MRNAWEIYDKLMNVDGTTTTERKSNKSKRKMLRYAPTNGTYFDVDINGEQRKILINSTNTMNKKTICSMPDQQFFLGDLIIWNSTYWLITEIEVSDFTYYRGFMERCTDKLRWINENGEEIERWCVVDNMASNSEGITINKIINLPRMVLDVQVTLDDETKKIRRGKRFLMDIDEEDPNAYVTTNRNILTDVYDEDLSHGVCKLVLSQEQRNEDNDNKEKMIADYNDFTPKEGETEGNQCSIEYSDKAEIRAGGTFKVFTAKFSNPAETPTWTVTTLDSHEKYYTIVEEGNAIKIKAQNNINVVGTQLKLELAGSSGSSCEMFVKVVSLLNG